MFACSCSPCPGACSKPPCCPRAKRAGISGSRGSRLPQGWGRVATDVFLRDLNLDVPLRDGRQIEVVANGLPAFGGSQVAVDVTLVSPVQRNGVSRPGNDVESGKALREAEERKRRTTYPELALAWRWAGGGRQRLRISSPAWRVEKPLSAQPASTRLPPTARRSSMRSRRGRALRLARDRSKHRMTISPAFACCRVCTGAPPPSYACSLVQAYTGQAIKRGTQATGPIALLPFF